MKNILKIEFNAVMTYDYWSIFEYNGSYYVADEDGIFEVKLKHMVRLQDYKYDVIDFDDDYNGESDDGEYALGFDKI